MSIKIAYENEKMVQVTNEKHEIWIKEKDDGNLIVEFSY